jgi:hypothetical protein
MIRYWLWKKQKENMLTSEGNEEKNLKLKKKKKNSHNSTCSVIIIGLYIIK